MEEFEKRLHAYKSGSGPKGASRDKRNLEYWANRASANSLHPPDGPAEKGTDDAEDKVREEAKKDLNHEQVKGAGHLQKVRRIT